MKGIGILGCTPIRIPNHRAPNQQVAISWPHLGKNTLFKGHSLHHKTRWGTRLKFHKTFAKAQLHNKNCPAFQTWQDHNRHHQIYLVICRQSLQFKGLGPDSSLPKDQNSYHYTSLVMYIYIHIYTTYTYIYIILMSFKYLMFVIGYKIYTVAFVRRTSPNI